MKRVLVTGAYGFIGRNLCVELSRLGYQLFKFGSSDPLPQLREMVKQADVIVHLAGINRPENPQEFYEGNSKLTKLLVNLVKEEARQIPIIYSSSTQALLDNDYGRSKRNAEDVLLQFNSISNNPVRIFRFPNLFGKWSKPNYNSVIATWCHNLINDQEIQIHNPDKVMTLAYIDDVVKAFIDEIEGSKTDGPFVEVKNVYTISLSGLAEKLLLFHQNRNSLRMPSFESDLDRYLYSTYLSYLPEDGFSYNLPQHKDERGWLSEFMKSESFGQIFISKTKPGISRGNHWHHSKVEKFLVIEGEAAIRFRHVERDDVIEYNVSGSTPEVLDIPPGYTHSITNIGNSDLITLFWANELFDPEKPDTYYSEVLYEKA